MSFRQSGNPNGSAQVVQVDGHDAIQLTTDDSGNDTSAYSLSQLVQLDNLPMHFELGYNWMNQISSDGVLDFLLNGTIMFNISHNGTTGGTVTSPLGLAYNLGLDPTDPNFSLLSFDLPALSALPSALADTFDSSGIGTLALNLYPGSPVGIQINKIGFAPSSSGSPSVPEPGTLYLMGMGLAALMLRRKKS
jgi:hypothetical protein